MLAFRSEPHSDRWREQRCVPRGALLTPEQLWGLADGWYRDRMSTDWRRRTPAEAEALFAELGLVGEFWSLQPAA